MKALVIVLMLVAGVAEARDEVLQWTATGDDGKSGRATVYDLRYKSIAPAGSDTTSLRIWWNSAGKVTGLMAPSTAGVTDTAKVVGLGDTVTYWFCLRVADEAGNWSGYGNIVESRGVDLIAPAQITDLREK